MTKQKKRSLFMAVGFLFAVALIFTLIVALVDRQPIGPIGSTVGLASVNQVALNFFGTSEVWDLITDAIAGFAILLVILMLAIALIQAIRRRDFRKIDPSLKILFATYLVMILIYAIFEVLVINCRPVLTDGALEASYPSSHVFLVTTILATVALELRILLKNSKLSRVAFAFLIFLAVVQVVGRELAGVHWFSDILGGVLFAFATIMLYYVNIKLLNE